MLREHALQHRAQVARGREIALLIQGLRGKTRPLRDDAAAPHRAPEEEGRRGGPMIGAAGAVHRGRATELRRRHDCGVTPRRAETILERAQACIKRAESSTELALRAALVGVRVPAHGIEHRYPRTVLAAQKRRGSAYDL